MHITEITPKIPQKAEKIRLAPYCRVSSDSADQMHSFATQIRYYSEYEKKNPQYQIVDIYADEGITGTEMEKRDEFNRLLRDCKRGMIDRIITKSVSRFARNTEELIATLRMLKEFGVSVYFEEQGIDTQQMNMEMIVTFPGMAAQQESETISGNVRWGIKKRMESGEFICSNPAYGYTLENGKMVIYEAEAVIVRRIFDMFLQGMGKQMIATILNEEGVPRRNGYTVWHATAVDYILRNEKYMGDAILEKTYTTNCLPYRQKRNNGEREKYYVENYCPAIISQEKYKAAQEMIAIKKGTKRGNTVYTLSKTMRCPDCGRLFRRHVANGKAYWCCSLLTANASKCKSRRVREPMVYDTFNMMIYKLKANRQDLLEPLIQRLEYLQSRTSENIERIRQIDKEIADLSAKNLVVTRLHTSGVLGTAEYSMQTSEISNKITELRIERRKKLTEDENDVMLDELKRLNEILKEYEPTSDFDEEMFEQIIESIIVDDTSRLTFHLIGGLTLTEEIKEKGRCRTA